MKPLVLGIAAAAMLTSGACLAQGSQGSAAGNAAASGNDNQAVATTNANASRPASGSNSFTMAQAKTRIEKQGFSNVNDLSKDSNGVWHGKAQKSGAETGVWLDYKGNVGETH